MFSLSLSLFIAYIAICIAAFFEVLSITPSDEALIFLTLLFIFIFISSIVKFIFGKTFKVFGMQDHKAKKWSWIVAPLWILPIIFMILWNTLDIPPERKFFRRTPLPSDEKIIAHFYAHKPAFEELVRRYYSYEGYGFDSEDNVEVKKLKMEAGIYRVDGGTPRWYPNPYSIEEYLQHKKASQIENRKYESVKFELKMALAQPTFLPLFRSLSKFISYYPQAPRVENGFFLEPASEKEAFQKSYPHVDSLNYIPDSFDSSCIVRRLEPQWFLRLCY